MSDGGIAAALGIRGGCRCRLWALVQRALVHHGAHPVTACTAGSRLLRAISRPKHHGASWPNLQQAGAPQRHALPGALMHAQRHGKDCIRKVMVQLLAPAGNLVIRASAEPCSAATPRFWGNGSSQLILALPTSRCNQPNDRGIR